MFAPNRQFDSHSGTRFYDYSNESPYDTFMKKHLQHYGYYTGKNDKHVKDAEGWQSDSSPDYKEYGSDDDYLNEALKDREKSDKELKSNQVVYNVNDGKVVTKLKEPRALFCGAQESALQPAKWPIEMEVLPERVRHIDSPPDAPEPFGTPNEFEPPPVIFGQEAAGDCRLVFKYEPVLSPFFIKSRVGGSRAISVCQLRADGASADDSLMFESRFESGNLRRAYRVGLRDYELWLRTDLYTSKHTQWFYFRVSNAVAGQTYRFTLVNFYKSASLYNEGLRPLMYSVRGAESRGVGWRRCATGIKYFKSSQRYTAPSGVEKSYYSLTWQTRFEYTDDTVYFAHCYPYTYSDLLDYLQALQDNPDVSRYCKQRVLCRSLAGNAVHLLTIGTPEQQQQQQQQRQKKPVILVTARVHPGESNASWMMKGFLDHLTSQLPDARLLRDSFTFKVVPMINPDGVIVGNYRCSLAGRDLNRNYRSPLRDSFPTVSAIVELVTRLQARGVQVALYCDLHGHSRRQNVFMYGCSPDKSTLSAASAASERFSERVFPAMVGRNAPDKFAPDSCKFRMQKSKEGTGRIVMYRLGVRCAYTMEATFGGSTLGGLAGFHFSCRHLEQMGAHLCDTLLDYFDPSAAKRDLILKELERRLKVQILANLQRSGQCTELSDPDQLNLADLPEGVADAAAAGADEADSAGDSSDDGGSDSSVSDGLPAHFEFMRKTGASSGGGGVGGRRKKRRSRKDLAAAAAGAAARKGSKATTSSASSSKRPIFCDHCGSARCPHNQPSEKTNGSPAATTPVASAAAATAARQKPRPSIPPTVPKATATPTTTQQQPPGRIRSAVTVERLVEGLKPVGSDTTLRAAAAIGRGFESPEASASMTATAAELTVSQQLPAPNNSVELLDVEPQPHGQQPQSAIAMPAHRLLDQQSRLAQRMLQYDPTQQQQQQQQQLQQVLSRAVSLDDANARIGRRMKAACPLSSSSNVAQTSSAGCQLTGALSMAETSPVLPGVAAPLESFNSSNTRLLASNRVRMRHRLPGPRVAAPPPAPSSHHPVVSAASNVASVEILQVSIARDHSPAHSTSLPAQLPLGALAAQAQHSSPELAVALEGQTACGGCVPLSTAEEGAGSTPTATASCPAQPLSPSHQEVTTQSPSRVQSIFRTEAIKDVGTKQSVSESADSVNRQFSNVTNNPDIELSSPLHAQSRQQQQQQQQQQQPQQQQQQQQQPQQQQQQQQQPQQQQRRSSQWRQPPGGQEIAQTFSQPTVVLSSGNKPPAPHLTAGQSRPSTISLQMSPPPGQSAVASPPVPRLPVAADAARRMSQFRAARRRPP